MVNHKTIIQQSILPLLVLGFFSVFLTYLYVTHWRLGFSSDTAMTSLTAKRIAWDGDLPIYIGAAGYHGMVLEGYLGALFFRVFGLSPIVANFAPTFYFFIFLLFFYLVIKRGWGSSEAFASTLFCIVSGPWIYLHVTRPIPNYSTTLMCGMLIFWIYSIWFEKIVHPGQKNKILISFVLGFLIGFSAYIFQLTVLFSIAVISHGILFSLFKLSSTERSQKIKRFLFPYLVIKPKWLKFIFVLYTVMGWAIVLLGAFVLLSGKIELSFMGQRYGVDGLNMILIPLSLLFSVEFIRVFLSSLLSSASFRKITIALVSGWALGFAPDFIYYKILGGTGGRGLALGGATKRIVERFYFFVGNHENLINFYFWKSPLDSIVIFTFFSSLIIVFIKYCYPLLTKIKSQRGFSSAEWDSKRIPFLILPLIIIPAFILNHRVIDFSSGRYLIPLVPFYSLCLGLACVSIFRSRNLGIWKGPLLGCFILFLVNNFSAIHRNLELDPAELQVERIARSLREHNFEYGIGAYWFAFATTFVSQEKIVLAPEGSKHLPVYQELIKGQPRLALVDLPTSNRGEPGSQFQYLGNTYEIYKYYPEKDFGIWELHLK